MSITHLGLLAILAPLYGGGALLIRESVRRTGCGWSEHLRSGARIGLLERKLETKELAYPPFFPPW